jgi:hypothetical protein
MAGGRLLPAGFGIFGAPCDAGAPAVGASSQAHSSIPAAQATTQLERLELGIGTLRPEY